MSVRRTLRKDALQFKEEGLTRIDVVALKAVIVLCPKYKFLSLSRLSELFAVRHSSYAS